MTEFDYCLKRDGEDFPVRVRGSYTGPSRGFRDSLGVPQEPDEPSMFEIEVVTDEEGNEVEVSDRELELLAEQGVLVNESRWE